MTTTITKAVLTVYRENNVASAGNMGVLYAEICRVMEAADPVAAPNPGSVYRIGRRFRDYGRDCWKGRTQ